MSVVIETTLGDITVDLYLGERPRACLNFLKLCKVKYYNFNLFHTISRGFIAQTGDPSGTRTGGESIFGLIDGSSKRYFEAESEPRIKHTRPGLISFVGGEDNMIGSQFFLTLGEDLTYLDEKHCVFGEVVEGLDILEAINEVICDNDDRPYQDVRITHTVVLDDPCPDPRGIRVPSRSPSPSAARLAGGRIAPDEEIDETSGRSAQEVAEMQAEREAKARATILEMVGDIPDAEMAPPENVLFVCKLNPVTSDDDLEIIFSRFGKIKSCEVIRDRKSGDSLQYAFIEFEEQKSCEDAYFKMGNVLIDDRRIHVDFSQSVSKVKWLGKGRGVAHYDNKGNKRKADTNNDIGSDIGKGNYKVQNGIKEEYHHRSRSRKESESPRRMSRSPVRENRTKNRSPKKYRQKSKSPIREVRPSKSPKREKRSMSSDRHSRNRKSFEFRRKQSPSPIKSNRRSRSPVHKRKRSRSPEYLLKSNNERRSYSRRTKSPRKSSSSNHRSPSHNRQKVSPRRTSRSPKSSRSSQLHVKRPTSPERSKKNLSRQRSESTERYKRVDRNRSPRRSVLTEKLREESKRAHRQSRSPGNEELVVEHFKRQQRSRSPTARSTLPKNSVQSSGQSSSSTRKKDKTVSPRRPSKVDNEKSRASNSKTRSTKEIQKEEDKKTRESKTKRPKETKTKRKKSKVDNSSDESETESEEDRPKRRKSKKKIESSTESDSSDDDSTSSSEDEKMNSKSKKRKSKKNAKVKKSKKTKKSKKKYSSSSSSSSSESDSSSSESSSSSSSSSSESDKDSKSKKKKGKKKKASSDSE